MAKRNQLASKKPTSQLLNDTRRMATGNYAEIERLEGEIRELENKAIVVSEGKYRFRNLEFSQVGFSLSGKDIDPNEWLDVFHAIAGLDDAVQWAIGDLIAYAEMKYGQTYSQLAEVTGYSVQTLQTYAYVAKRIEILTRIKDLSFSHHRLVAKFVDENDNPDSEKQAYWLSLAQENGWNRADFEVAIKQAERKLKSDGTQSVTADSWLFDQRRKPKVNHLQRLWTRARDGDEQAMNQLQDEIRSTREWLDEIESSLNN